MNNTSQDSRAKNGKSESGISLLVLILLSAVLIFLTGYIVGGGCQHRGHVSPRSNNSDEYEDDRLDRGRWVDVRE